MLSYPQLSFLFFLHVNDRSHILVTGQNNNKYSTKHMSHEQYIKILRQELQKVNEEIDIKIIKGEMYASQAHKHRMLLNRMRKHAKKTFTDRLFGSLTSMFRHA